MGIYDREYYRGEAGGPGWFGGVAPWCKTLIVVNCVVFLLQQSNLDQGFIDTYFAAWPEQIFKHGRIWQLWTGTFLHADILHILFNMWFLWMVGREMESVYGSKDFLAFYLSAAGVSTLVWAAIHLYSGAKAPLVGASGAVTACLTLYTLFYPRREILFFFVPMPMWVMLVLFLGLDLFLPKKGVAYEAHLAGAAFAFTFKQLDLRWSRLVSGRFKRPRLKVFSPPVEYDAARPRVPAPGRSATSGEGFAPKVASTPVISQEQLDERLDEVLAKIAREGRSSLTDEEQRILQEASRRAQSKRSGRL